MNIISFDGNSVFLMIYVFSSLLYIEEDLLPDVGKGHKSDGDPREETNTQVRIGGIAKTSQWYSKRNALILTCDNS